MSMFQDTVPMSPNDLINAVRQLDTHDFESFASEVVKLRARRQAPSVPRREAELLAEINTGVSEAEHQRYRALLQKRQLETLTAAEYEEFVGLIDQIELQAARRVEKLAELARLRGVTLIELMDDLGIASPGYA